MSHAMHNSPGLGSPDPERLTDHDYDGIQEFDNPLPGWWTWLFVGSIAFSLAYVAWYHIGLGPSIHDRYEAQVAAHVERQLAQLGDIQPDNATILDFVERDDWMQAMGGIFRGTCAQCHAADGGGSIGPNMTDDHYRWVRQPSDIVGIIRSGIPGTSMPAFGDRFRDPQIILLAAYVASLRNTTPAAPKAAEGDRIPPWSNWRE